MCVCMCEYVQKFHSTERHQKKRKKKVSTAQLPVLYYHCRAGMTLHVRRREAYCIQPQLDVKRPVVVRREHARLDVQQNVHTYVHTHVRTYTGKQANHRRHHTTTLSKRKIRSKQQRTLCSITKTVNLLSLLQSRSCTNATTRNRKTPKRCEVSWCCKSAALSGRNTLTHRPVRGRRRRRKKIHTSVRKWSIAVPVRISSPVLRSTRSILKVCTFTTTPHQVDLTSF